MATRSAYHTETAAAFLLKARVYLDEGDLLQASEKGWGAAARMIKAVAEERGWPHTSHGDLHRAVDRLAGELADEELKRLFHSAGALHRNFYEGWMPEETVARGLRAVESFVHRLDDALS